MTLATLDWAVLLAYLAAILLIGFYFARRNTSTEEYFVGGRRFRGWVIGLSLVGTSISSVTFLAYPADAFKTGWLRYLPNLALPLALLMAARVFLPFFRRGNMTSAYEFLEQRFGPSVRVYGALAFIVAQLVRLAMILYLLSLLILQLVDVSPTVAIIAAGLFVGLYTIVGGIDAVIWTDVMQTLVLLIGGLLCIWVVVDALPGGLGQVFREAGAAGKFALAEWRDGEPRPVRWGLSLSEKTATMMLFIGLTNWLTEYSSNQNTVQRYCASRSTRKPAGACGCTCSRRCRCGPSTCCWAPPCGCSSSISRTPWPRRCWPARKKRRRFCPGSSPSTCRPGWPGWWWRRPWRRP